MASRSKQFAACAAKAAVSAVAIYNQPHNNYREDSFCILAVNAWELLLKAKILKENKNKLTSIFLYRKEGRRKIVRTSRTGATLTIGIFDCIKKIENQIGAFDPNAKNNLDVLVGLRDSATHFVNSDPALSDRIFRIGSASMINFFRLFKLWFGENEELKFAPIPLAFGAQNISNVENSTKPDVKKVIDFIDSKIESQISSGSDYAVAIQMQVSFTKDKGAGAPGVRITNNPNAPEVRLSEDDFQRRYPMDYKTMCSRAKIALPGLKINNDFTALVSELRQDPSLCHTRYLDPKAKKGSKKFYSEAMITKLVSNRAQLDFSDSDAQ
ncbi:MAG: DUF3644 domain-containing protein [Xanthobacteraceae bacterium]|nr:DUF3644 domain-containing protein [Xanthobacteraceae bacterium]MCW5677816.1 DUF3644 domain-containing protein [Xanthobacteraceae bacterium]